MIEFEHNGIVMKVEDVDNSIALTKDHLRELRDDGYALKDFNLKINDVVIDVGANVGVVSIYMAKRCLGARILAYEPVPATYEKLIYNIKQNDLTNIKPFMLAVHSKSDMAMGISINPYHSGAANKFGAADITARTISFDDIVLQNNIKEIAFLKIDCEGSELEFIEGSTTFDTIPIRHIGIEIHRDVYHLDYDRCRRLAERIKAKCPSAVVNVI